MKRFMSCIVFIFFLMALTPLYAGTQTLTTYYPAPQGNYNNVTVSQVLTLNPQGAAGPCSGGASSTVTLTDVNGTLEVCDGVTGLTRPTSLWSITGNYIYPVNSGNTVCIGCSSAVSPPNTNNGNPLPFEVNGQMSANSLALTGPSLIPDGNMLDVAGNVSLPGNVTLGSTGGVGVGATVVNGSFYGGGPNTLNGGALITGAFVVGAPTASTTATINAPTVINGATTINGTTLVSGNTTLGEGSGSTTYQTTMVGNTVMTGNATIQGTTTMCSSSNGLCGTFLVSCDGTNCYPTYGP